MSSGMSCRPVRVSASWRSCPSSQHARSWTQTPAAALPPQKTPSTAPEARRVRPGTGLGRGRCGRAPAARLVHAGDHAVQHLALEGAEDQGVVRDGELGVRARVLDHPLSDVGDGGDQHHEAVPAGAGALHLRAQALVQHLPHLRAEPLGLQQQVALQRHVEEAHGARAAGSPRARGAGAEGRRVSEVRVHKVCWLSCLVVWLLLQRAGNGRGDCARMKVRNVHMCGV